MRHGPPIVSIAGFVIFMLCSTFVLAQDLPTYRVELLSYQKDSPVQIASIRTSITRFFDGALLVNGGDSTLLEVQIGGVMRGHRRGEAALLPPYTFVSPTIDLVLEPGKATELEALSWRRQDVLSQAIKLGLESFEVTFGIVKARFASGTGYEYDLKAAGEFVVDPQNPYAIRAHKDLDRSTVERFIDQAQKNHN